MTELVTARLIAELISSIFAVVMFLVILGILMRVDQRWRKK